MKIKTFPLQFTEKELEEIGKIAKNLGESKKDFILKAIRKRMKEEK